MTSKDVLAQKDLPEKAATMKRFEFSPLGKKLKAQTDIAKKQYQKLDNTYEFDKIIKKENYSNSNLIYDLIIVFINIIMIEKNLITFPSSQSILF